MTIVDIAKESGYSVSTVSRVLNNRRDVSPAAKKKIMEIVEAHNFVPNNNAKNLKQVVSKTIIVLVKGTSNMLFANIIEEIQSVVGASDYTAAVYYLDEDEDEVFEALRLSRERKPLGILLLGGNPENATDKFEQITIPCVMVTNRADEVNCTNLSSVSTDDTKAAEKAVDYLIEHGHTKIAEIGGDLKISQTAINRHRGCVKSFKKHNLEMNEAYYEKARFSYDSSYRAMTRLLDKDIEISAVFAMSDVMAIGAIRAIRDRGLNVPEDISIMGFDGTTLADYYNPKIVSVRQGYKQMAVRSVEILISMIDLNKPATHELIPFTLTDGESVKKLV